MQSQESFRGSITEVCLELGIVSIAIVKKNDKKVCPWQTWKRR